jgi:triphosphatase
LRAAVSVFKAALKDVVADAQRDAIRDGLRWIATALGEARDLDVFIADVLEPVRDAHADEPGLAALARSLSKRREQAYDRALAAVASRRFRTLVIDTAAWIETGPWTMAGDASTQAEPIEAFACRELARRRRTVRKRGKDLAGLAPRARHAVRIAAKKLRYATEFFAPLFEGRTAEERRDAFLSALERLQEHLGELNDLTVGREKHPDWFQAESDDGDPAAHAAHLVAKRQSARARRALRSALTAYRDFAAAKRFWR